MGSVPKVAKADNRSTGRGPSTEHMRLSTPAKINWNLRVLERRADGFHEIESLFSAVSLVDELAFEIRSDTRITLHCTGLEVASDNSNLVMQAARLMAERSCCTRGVSCQLTKVIPVGGGLGGGSSDAAATLLALNKLWGLDWPRENLLDLAAELGSDVSFFLTGGSAVISGRGEYVHPIDLPWHGWVVLMLPAWGISTAEVYRAWQSAPGPAESGPTVPVAGCNARDWMAQTFNMLETAAMKVCPAMRDPMIRAEQLAARPVRLSGSGSTFFTAFDEQEEAEFFARQVSGLLNVATRVVQPVTGGSCAKARPVGGEEFAPSPRNCPMVYMGGDTDADQ